MSWAKRYIGTPYLNKGRNIETGVDCWGLVYIIYQDILKCEVPLYSHEYHNSEDSKEIGALINKEKLAWEETTEPREFDIVVLRLKGEPMHCGVILDKNKFIHILKGISCAIEKVSSPVWKNRIIGFYRHESRR